MEAQEIIDSIEKEPLKKPSKLKTIIITSLITMVLTFVLTSSLQNNNISDEELNNVFMEARELGFNLTLQKLTELSEGCNLIPISYNGVNNTLVSIKCLESK